MAQDPTVSTEATKPDPFQQAGLIPAGSVNDPSPSPTGSSIFEAEGLIPAGNVQMSAGGDGATLGQQAGAAAESGARAGIASGGFVAGAIVGTKLGTAAAPFAGPLAPAAPFVGGLVGAVAGAVGTDWGAEQLGLRSPSDLPENLRPAGYFGESFGGSLPFVGLPYALNSAGYRAADTVVGRFFNKILDTAAAKPKSFLAAELSATTSAAIAAGLIEEIAPGKTGIRIGAEVVAGVTNPTRWAVVGFNAAVNKIKNVSASMGAAGRETAAGQFINELASLTGEDPTVLARVLQERTIVIDGKEVPLTAAQITGSPALIGLDSYLRAVDPAYGAEAQRRANEALDTIGATIMLLRGTGDETALQQAAELTGQYFTLLIDGRSQRAIEEAVTAARRITADTPAAKAEISASSREIIGKAIADARRAETELHSLVDGTIPVDFVNLQQAYDNIVADLIPELLSERTPTIVRDFLKRIGTPAKSAESSIWLPENIGRDVVADIPGTNVAEMRQLRSELLDLSRNAADKGNYGQARIFNTLAEAVLDDMDAAFVARGDTTYDTARQFSRKLNETFNRSFVGKVTATGRYGEKIAPELTLTKALASGKEAGAIQLQELEEATRFMVTEGFADSGAVREMMVAQERIIRLAAADAIDLETGLIKPAQLRKFINDNEILMNRFPEIRDDLQRAIDSEDARSAMLNLAKRQSHTMATTKAFTSIAKVGQVSAADRMLLSRNQEQDLMRLINVAKVGGRTWDGMQITPEQATKGLRAAVIDAAVKRSTNRRTGDINFQTFQSFLFNPSVPGRKAPIEILQENGVFTAEEVGSMRRLFDTADRIRLAETTSGIRVDTTEDAGDMVVSLISRIAGSLAARKGASAVGATATIQVPAAGARFVENLTKKLPLKSRQEALVQLMLNPDKAALVLTDVGDPYQAAIVSRQINAWLIQSGIVSAKELMEADEPQVDPMSEPGFLRQPR